MAPIGFRNLGNTCYLNALTQVLLRGLFAYHNRTSTAITPQQLPPGSSVNICNLSIGKAFATLYEVVRKLEQEHKTPACVTPVAFVRAVLANTTVPSLRRRGSQQDAHELLLLLVDSSPRLRCLSQFTFASLVFGSERSRTNWTSHHISVHLGSSISTVLKQTMETYDILEDGREKRMCLTSPPLLLMVHLRRWHPLTHRKLTNPVTIDGKVRLQVYSDSDVCVMKSKKHHAHPTRVCEYELIGIVHHLGTSANCGHYVSHVNSGTPTAPTWYHCNDSHVKPCTSPIDCPSKTAYICMYRLHASTSVSP